MSDSELEEVSVLNWFDSESDLPEMWVNVGQTPVNTPHDWALGDEDSDATDSAPNTGTLAGNALLERLNPIQWVIC